MKVKFIKILFVFSLLSFLLVPVGWAQEIKSIKVITPAWATLTNKDGTGLYFDLVRKIFEPAGIKVYYEIAPWKRAKKKITSGESDFMLAAYLTKDNPDYLYPENPMDVDYTIAIFLKDKIKWKAQETLKNKTVVWKRGYNYHNYLDVPVKWSEVNESEQAWNMVKKNRVDFYLDILPDINAYIKKNNIDMKNIGKETAFTINTYMRFGNSERSKKLISIFDKRMDIIKQNGELEEVFKKWGHELPPWKPEK